MKLISMADFVLQVGLQAIESAEKRESLGYGLGKGVLTIEYRHSDFDKCNRYAHFLKQPLELWMFVPCEDGKALKYPRYSTYHSDDCYCDGCEKETKRCSELTEQYLIAKEKVLFKGAEHVDIQPSTQSNFYQIKNRPIFRMTNMGHWFSLFDTVEDLVKFDVELTESAVKQLGL